MDKFFLKMKSKEDKIYSYVVLVIGLLFLYIYFYMGNFSYGWTIKRTFFSTYWMENVGVRRSNIEFFFVIHQILFIFFYWYIREDIVKLLKWVHSKI